MPSNAFDDELWRLYDTLNLTGRVIRIGQHAVNGGCSNVWEARLVPLKLGCGFNCEAVNGSGDGERVAVKVIREVGSSASGEILKKRLIREVRAWHDLNHRNVLPLLGFTYGFVPGSHLASLVSPWMPNGTARRYLARQTVLERIRVLTGVADGLSFLHRHGVVHGDLKGENVMIDMNFEPRIADFGLSKLLDEVSTNLTKTATGDALGSIRWTAPELFLTPGVKKWTDIWSFGMTMLELFTNAPPYRDLVTDAQVIIMVHKGVRPQRPSLRFGMDDDIWNLCCSCWRSNPELRPSTRVIAKQLWELDLNRKLSEHKFKKRRASPSPERSRTSRQTESCSDAGSESRLRKSPRLSVLDELTGDSLPSPGSSLPSQRALVRTPAPRTPTHRPTFSTSHRMSSGSSWGSQAEIANEFDPRRFLTSMHSDGDVFTSLPHHYPHAIHRTQSEPVGFGLISANQSLSSDSSGDLSLALSTPRQDTYDSFGTPPISHAQVHGQYYMGHQQPLLMNGTNDLELLSQTEFLGGYDADVVHPSQWTSSYPEYIHSALVSSFPPRHGSEVYYGGLNMSIDGHNPTSSSPFLLPAPLPEVEGFTSGYSPSLENAVPSPHALGELFFENFPYGQPPDNASPLLLNEPLYSSPQPLYQGLHPDVYQTPPLSQPLGQQPHVPWPSSSANVDFNSLQQGIISPALSDISAVADTHPQTHSTPLLDNFGDTPLFGGYEEAFTFEDEGESLGDGLALIGGLDISSDFGIVAPDATPTMMMTPASPPRRGEEEEEETRDDSPQQLEFVVPFVRQDANSLHPPEPEESNNMHMPPTPGMSPLLSSF